MNTPSDFTAWLRGFLDAVEGSLSQTQLDKIRERLATVEAVEPAKAAQNPAPPVFVPYRVEPWPQPTPWWHVDPYVKPWPGYPQPYIGDIPPGGFGEGGTWCGTLTIPSLADVTAGADVGTSCACGPGATHGDFFVDSMKVLS